MTEQELLDAVREAAEGVRHAEQALDDAVRAAAESGVSDGSIQLARDLGLYP